MEEEFHNHMRIPWHDHTRKSIGRPITEASLSEKASIIGRTGIMLLSCGTWNYMYCRYWFIVN